jgi:hypothetical protein
MKNIKDKYTVYQCKNCNCLLTARDMDKEYCNHCLQVLLDSHNESSIPRIDIKKEIKPLNK